VSESTKAALIKAGIEENKITRIYNGIDYSKFKNIKLVEKKSNTYHFIYFGRLGISKGLNLLLAGVQKLSIENKEFLLNLVIPKTPKGFYDTIIKEIEKFDIKDHIKISSHLPYTELQELISSSDAAIIPSYSEGFCFSAVEAMALNIPIIHSGKGALAEVVTGPQIKMSNMDAESLKECMENAISEKWTVLPKKEFHLTDSVEAYLYFYKKLNT
jgi:glycosyltransferase involved in cell wall biosynthesis